MQTVMVCHKMGHTDVHTYVWTSRQIWTDAVLSIVKMLRAQHIGDNSKGIRERVNVQE